MSTKSKSLEKIEAKITALESFNATKIPQFDLPKSGRFSFNWFCELVDEAQGLQKVSKALSELRSNTPTRARIDQALSGAQIVFHAISNLDVEQVTEMDRLRGENRDLKAKMARLAQDVLKLMDENDQLKVRMDLQQAQWQDKMRVQQLADSVLERSDG